jgi:hypothetical protein
MGQWISVDKKFIEADVIRWEEAVFARSGRRSRRPIKIGSRRVTAEVTKGPDGDGWVTLLVRQCEVLTETVIGQVVEKFNDGSALRRSRKTILRGAPERLLWTDETARDAVLKSIEPSQVGRNPQARRRRGNKKRTRPNPRKPTRR